MKTTSMTVRSQRTLLSIILSVTMALPVISQIWCPAGTTWTYTYSNSWTTEGYARFMYTGDTVIDGFTSQRIDSFLEYDYYPFDTTYAFQDGPYYTSVNGGLVSIWDGVAFDTLYDFSAVPGDHWLAAMPDGGESWVYSVVADTGTLAIDGLSLRFLTLQNGDTIAERLGQFNDYFLPWVGMVQDDAGGPLRCYSDVDLDHTQWWWNFGCASWLGLDAPRVHAGITLSPNPGNERFMIKGLGAASVVRILDAIGRVCIQQRCSTPNSMVSTATLPSGVYTVQAFGPDGSECNARWVKE
jgi:hypothetical protein